MAGQQAGGERPDQGNQQQDGTQEGAAGAGADGPQSGDTQHALAARRGDQVSRSSRHTPRTSWYCDMLQCDSVTCYSVIK